MRQVLLAGRSIRPPDSARRPRGRTERRRGCEPAMASFPTTPTTLTRTDSGRRNDLGRRCGRANPLQSQRVNRCAGRRNGERPIRLGGALQHGSGADSVDLPDHRFDRRRRRSRRDPVFDFEGKFVAAGDDSPEIDRSASPRHRHTCHVALVLPNWGEEGRVASSEGRVARGERRVARGEWRRGEGANRVHLAVCSRHGVLVRNRSDIDGVIV